MSTQNQTEPLLILYSRPWCPNNILMLAKYDLIQPYLGRFLCSLVLPYLLFLCSWQIIWHMCVSKQNACYFISFIDFSGHDGKDEQKNKTILEKYHFLLWVASSFKFYNFIEVNNKMYVLFFTRQKLMFFLYHCKTKVQFIFCVCVCESLDLRLGLEPMVF